MLTPQEVASHSFSKATLGGYNMAMVDEFLDSLTEDYTALYNDNAILKNKLKVLSETVEEFRATDAAMRKTLLAAQQMADAMVRDAEKKRDQIMKDAEAQIGAKVDELDASVAAEQRRLQKAQQATASYIDKLQALHDRAGDFILELSELVPPDLPKADAAGPSPVEAVKASVTAMMYSQISRKEDGGQMEPGQDAGQDTAVFDLKGESAGEDAEEDDPSDATRRFDDLQFGKDYEIS